MSSKRCQLSKRDHYSSQCFTKSLREVTEGEKTDDQDEDVDVDSVFIDAITEQS